jgi:hypothetical protein
MQKIDLQDAGENLTLAAVTVLYFSAIALFSIWFTQG